MINKYQAIKKYFGDVCGTMVVVGGGGSFAGTCELELLQEGWRACVAEPSSHLVDVLSRSVAGLDVCVKHCFIGENNQRKDVVLYGIHRIAFAEKHAAALLQLWGHTSGTQRHIENVEHLTLNTYLSESGILPGFEVLIVDTEGNESIVLNSFDFSEWRPKMIIVELRCYHRGFNAFTEIQQEHNRLREFIVQNGYKEYDHNMLDTFFIREDI